MRRVDKAILGIAFPGHTLRTIICPKGSSRSSGFAKVHSLNEELTVEGLVVQLVLFCLIADSLLWQSPGSHTKGFSLGSVPASLGQSMSRHLTFSPTCFTFNSPHFWLSSMRLVNKSFLPQEESRCKECSFNQNAKPEVLERVFQAFLSNTCFLLQDCEAKPSHLKLTSLGSTEDGTARSGRPMQFQPSGSWNLT